MSKINDANKAKDALKKAGVPLPDGFNDLTYAEQAERGKELLEEHSKKGESPKADASMPELPSMSNEQFEAVLGAIKELKGELRKKDADIAALNKRIEERGSGVTGSQYDPNYIRMMKDIARGEFKDGMVPMEYANDEDRLDEPVTFFGRKSNIKIWVIQSSGKNISPPNGYDCVRFTNHFWYPNHETGKPNVLCSFTTSSKIMSEYVRLDPRFGVEFFDDIEEASALSERSRWADFREQRILALRSKPQHEVQAMAPSLGIRTGSATDYPNLLKLIAEKLADQDEAAMKSGEAALRKENDPSVLMRHKDAIALA